MERLTNEGLKRVAKNFAEQISQQTIEELLGVSDGKHIGTYLEHSFKEYLKTKFISNNWGSSAKGIDLPDINTDIKFTSIQQPQSSLPFKDAGQKIFGLGYNLIIFVYDKDDKRERNIIFKNVSFVDESKTADFTITKLLRETIRLGGNDDDLYAILADRNIPGDDITYRYIIHRIREKGVNQGYITITNALQWRASYRRVVEVSGTITGVDKLYG